MAAVRTCQPDHVERHVVEPVHDVYVEGIACLDSRQPDVAELACLVHKYVRYAAYLCRAKGRVLGVRSKSEKSCSHT